MELFASELCICHLQDKETLVMMNYDDLGSTSCCCSCGGCHTSLADYAHYQYKSHVIYIHPSCAWMSVPLPRDNLHWNVLSRSGLLQYNALYYLSVKCVINWCAAISPLYPILTAGIHLVFVFVIPVLCDISSYLLCVILLQCRKFKSWAISTSSSSCNYGILIVYDTIRHNIKKLWVASLVCHTWSKEKLLKKKLKGKPISLRSKVC